MTKPDHVWRQIEALLRDATTRVVIVAPFIKKTVFEAALAAIPQSVKRIECVTRWAPAEVAAGVSDPEILNLADEDPRLHVALCASLHAKIYGVDEHRYLIGSANLTGKATGLAPGANIELLIELSASHPEVDRVLGELESAAVPATKHMALLVRRQADALAFDGAPDTPSTLTWYPATRRPQNLYAFYSGKSQQFPPAVESGILEDLALLNIPAGLSESQFNIAVRDRLRAIPELRKLLRGDRLSSTDLQYAIEERTSLPTAQAQRITENIATWLQHFDHYYTEVGSWELRRGRELTP